MFKEIVANLQWTTYDGHRVILKAPIEHVVLRGAKKHRIKIR